MTPTPSAASAASKRYSIYTGRATNWPMLVLTAVLAVFVVALGKAPNARWWSVAVPLVAVTVGVLASVLTASSLRTTAGPNGVTVHFGVMGWPRCTYPLAQIERAEVIDLPWWFVSWGLWWTPRRTCCTMRSGPTLRLLLRTGRSVSITVPDPAAAVAAIDDAMSRQTS